MKRDVNPTIEKFDKEAFASLLSNAKGDLSRSEYAEKSGLSLSFLSHFLNGKTDKPPAISSLKKIAASSESPYVTFDKLLEACGYTPENLADSKKYKNYQTISKTIDSILFSVLPSGFWPFPFVSNEINGKKIDSSCYNSYDWIIDREDFSYWTLYYFSLSNNDPAFIKDQLDKIYGRCARADFPANSKFSFVTYDKESYDVIVASAPLQLSLYVSVILLDLERPRVVKETYLKTAREASPEFRQKYALSTKRIS